MGALTSRQNAAVEEADNTCSHQYKYPPRQGNFFSSHFIMGGERFNTSQPEAYLFGENNDLNFLLAPAAFPYPPPQANEPTKTLKSLVNIRKETVRFIKVNETESKPNEEGMTNKGVNFNIEFVFDADAKCAITIHYLCTEELSPTGLTYHSKGGIVSSPTFHYKRGASQTFSQPAHNFNPSLIPEDELQYCPDTDIYPIVIHCVVEEGYDEVRQSHTTVCVVDHHADNTYGLRALKQKIFVDGLVYLLQEIYGIENKNLNKVVATDDECDDNGSECVICMSDQRDTLILPCRHLCLCYTCANSLRYQANNCPICRAPFRALLQIRAVQRSNAHGSNLIIAPNHPCEDSDGIPPGYVEVSLIEALNGPPPKGRPITPTVSGSGELERTTSFIDSRSGTLERNKPGALERKGSSKDNVDSSVQEPQANSLVRSSSTKEKSGRDKLSNRGQSVREGVKLVNEKTANTLGDDDDSEAEKLSPLLNNKVVKIPTKKTISGSMQLGNPTENDVDAEDMGAKKKQSTRAPATTDEGAAAVGPVVAASPTDSDFLTPEEPHTNILNSASNEQINLKEIVSTKEKCTPLTLLKDSVISLPDSPQSGNSQASRSSGDSYSSSSSTKQLLSSVMSNDVPAHMSHISGVDHIRIADDDKKSKSTTNIVNV